MAKLNKEMIEMINEMYARRKNYYFIDKTVSPDDEYREVAVKAESLLEAWDVLDWDRDRYEYVDGPEDEEDYEGLF